MKNYKIIIIGLALVILLSSCGLSSDSESSVAEITSTVSQLDNTMPEPFVLNTVDSGGDQLRRYYDPYDIRYKNIPGTLMDLLDKNKVNDWINQFDSNAINERANIYYFLKDLNISKDTAVEWLKRENELDDELGISHSLTLDDINILYSDNEELIKENFVSEYTILSNGKIYTPEWIYTHSLKDYEAEEISFDLISSKLSLYEDIPFTSEALTALENKVNSYAKMGLMFDKTANEKSKKEIVTTPKKETTTTTVTSVTSASEQTKATEETTVTSETTVTTSETTATSAE